MKSNIYQEEEGGISGQGIARGKQIASAMPRHLQAPRCPRKGGCSACARPTRSHRVRLMRRLVYPRRLSSADSVAGAAALALGHQGVVVTSELLARVMSMPVNPARKHTAWGFRRRAALASFLQTYPRSVLPAEKFQQEEGEST